MLSYNCSTCAVFWTPARKSTLVANPEKSNSRLCPDCADGFDWPVYTKALSYVSSLNLPKQERRKDRIAREKAEKEAAALENEGQNKPKVNSDRKL